MASAPWRQDSFRVPAPPPSEYRSPTPPPPPQTPPPPPPPLRGDARPRESVAAAETWPTHQRQQQQRKQPSLQPPAPPPQEEQPRADNFNEARQQGVECYDGVKREGELKKRRMTRLEKQILEAEETAMAQPTHADNFDEQQGVKYYDGVKRQGELIRRCMTTQEKTRLGGSSDALPPADSQESSRSPPEPHVAQTLQLVASAHAASGDVGLAPSESSGESKQNHGTSSKFSRRSTAPPKSLERHPQSTTTIWARARVDAKNARETETGLAVTSPTRPKPEAPTPSHEVHARKVKAKEETTRLLLGTSSSRPDEIRIAAAERPTVVPQSEKSYQNPSRARGATKREKNQQSSPSRDIPKIPRSIASASMHVIFN